MSDRLTLAHAFEDAGIARDKAELVATAVLDAIRDNVATKADLQIVRTELKTEIQAVRTELKTEIQAVRSELAVGLRDMKIWTGSVLVALFTLQLVLGGLAIRYLPPVSSVALVPPAAGSR